MRVNYDREADVLHVLLVEGQSDASQEVAPGVYIETDVAGRVVGVEITSASQRSDVRASATQAAA